MSKCIYCKDTYTERKAFNKEHVVLHSLTVGLANNLTLIRKVCKKCNSEFGENLDKHLLMGPIGKCLRVKFGLITEEKFKSTLKIAEGKYKGLWVIVEYLDSRKKLLINGAPSQVCFLKKSSKEYEYFLVDKIPDKNWLKKNGFELKPSTLRIFGQDPKNIKEIKTALKEKNINFKEGETFYPLLEQKQNEILTEIEEIIEKTVLRGYAKIAFNYLAYFNSPDFMLKEYFDPIRNFIKNGEKPSFHPVEVISEGIQENNPGHIIKLELIENKTVVVSLSLLNFITFKIYLTNDYKEKPFRSKGHVFNFRDKNVDTLENFNREIPFYLPNRNLKTYLIY